MIIYTYDSNENLTGSFDLLKTVPLSFIHSEHSGRLDMSFLGACDSITEGGFVGFEDIVGDYQMFEVVQSTQTHSDKGLIYEYSCEHIYYELLSDVVDDSQSYAQLPMEAALRVLENTRWTLGRYFTAEQHSFGFSCQSVLSALTKISDGFGCRIRYRLSHKNGEITGRFVDLIEKGQNITSKRFVWGKDIMSLTRKIDTRDVYTALYGQGKSVKVSDSDSGEQYERVNFGNVFWSKEDCPVVKPLGQLYVADEDALEKYGRGKPDKKHHRYGIAIFDSIDDAEQLLAATWELLQTVNKPKVSYNIKALDLATLCGYAHEAFHIGDTVRIVDKAFSPELETYITITRLDRDYLYPENTEITLGSEQSDMADILHKLSESQAKLRNKEGIFDTVVDPNSRIETSRLKGPIDAFRNYIVCSDDYQAAKPNPETGILLENTNPNSTGYGALYLGPGVFSIANSKTSNGLWRWKTFGHGSGFIADCITTGVLLADLIKTGVLQSYNGKSYINMDDGTFSLGEGAIVYDGENSTKFTGNIEIAGGNRSLYMRPDESNRPLIGFQISGSDVGYVYAKNSENLIISSNYNLVLTGLSGVKLTNGPLTLPNGEKGYSGSVTVGGKTLYFNNGILYKVS